MIRPVGPLQFGWMFPRHARVARSGPESGALSRQLSALERRRRLRMQHQQFLIGGPGPKALPPYPFRPRPPP